MTTREAPAFGDVLSHYRLAAGLTQEELAERANLSVRGISDLERGVRTRPQPMTVRQLAEALQLSPQDRAIFEEAAHASGAARRRDEALPQGSFLGALPAAPLVGREDDAERMSSILDAVVEGPGHVLLFCGELGVGKTRLLQELMVAALSRDFLVLTGRCDAAEQQRLYAPFLAALGGLTASMPSGARSNGQRLWKRVQQLTRAVSDRADTVEQQHLFGAVAELVVLISRSVPLVLLLDDLQWADSGSLKLLQHLARTTRSSSVLLAGAFRDLRLSEEHPDLAHALQLLSRERLAERITVRRLSLEEMITCTSTRISRCMLRRGTILPMTRRCSAARCSLPAICGPCSCRAISSWTPAYPARVRHTSGRWAVWPGSGSSTP
jgi:transcriptional regulator with XRE-family HTH domain